MKNKTQSSGRVAKINRQKGCSGRFVGFGTGQKTMHINSNRCYIWLHFVLASLWKIHEINTNNFGGMQSVRPQPKNQSISTESHKQLWTLNRFHFLNRNKCCFESLVNPWVIASHIINRSHFSCMISNLMAAPMDLHWNTQTHRQCITFWYLIHLLQIWPKHQLTVLSSPSTLCRCTRISALTYSATSQRGSAKQRFCNAKLNNWATNR